MKTDWCVLDGHNAVRDPMWIWNRVRNNRYPVTCKALSDLHLVCTRPSGHTGRHAASTGPHIVAVWSD